MRRRGKGEAVRQKPEILASRAAPPHAAGSQKLHLPLANNTFFVPLAECAYVPVFSLKPFELINECGHINTRAIEDRNRS